MQIVYLVLLAGSWIDAPGIRRPIAEIAALPNRTLATADAAVILATADLVADPGLKSSRSATKLAITIYGTQR